MFSSRSGRGRWAAIGVGLVVLIAAAWGVYGRRVDPQAEWRLIGDALAARKWEEAERRLGRWLERSPEDGKAWVYLGGLMAEKGRTDDELAAFRRVKESDPAWPMAQTRIGEAARRDGKLAEAEGAFWAAAQADPRAIEPRAKLVGLLTIQDRPDEARAILWEVYRLSRDQRHLAALTGLAATGVDDVASVEPVVDRFLSRAPTDVWLRRARGMLLLRQGRHAEALPFLEDATRLPDDLDGRFALAECRLALGRVEGLDALLNVPAARPKDRARRLSLLAQAEELRGNDEQALADWRRAVDADPEDRLVQYRLGRLLVRRGDKEAAQPHLDRAEAIDRRQGRLKSLLSKITAPQGKDAALYEAIGETCLESGLPAEARAWYDEAIRFDPTRSSAQAALARLAGESASPPSLTALRPRPTAAVASTSPAETPTVRSGPRFEEVSLSAGLAFRYTSGATDDLFIADTMGGGVGLIDYDGDGWLDVYLVNGCALPFGPGKPPAPNKLFRNRGDGTFEDVTDRTGVRGRGYGMGCTVGDFDGDGRDDLFVTGFRDTILYRNRGDGTFEDVTDRAGVRSDRWCTAAGFADLDGDRDLDLVVIAYVDADPARPGLCRDATGKRIHCTPGEYRAQLNHLFRNDGDGAFTDVAHNAGLALSDRMGLGLAVADFDGDGKLDLFVANDAVPDCLFRNLGGLRFEEVGVASGLAYDGKGHATASMGVVADDLDGDGLIDVFHTNLINEGSTLARNLGGGLFADVSEQAGILAPSRSVTGFGAVALDADNDGRLDLFAANGHVDDKPWQNRPMAQPPHFYRSVADGRFELADPSATGEYFTRPVVGRGAAVGDLDNDGRLDIVVVHRDAQLAFLRNTSDAGHSIGLRLHGDRSTPVGARVACRAGGRTMVRWVTSGTGYLSSNDPRLWFGLGDSRSVEALEIRWPSGMEQKWSDVPGDQILDIHEGKEPAARRSLPSR